MIRILFCNISYLPYYNTRLDRVAPKNGGAYVAKMHDAYEKHNFEECADGQYRGFVETKYRIGYEEGIATNTYNSLHIERIDPFAKGKTYLDDVLVVFCAKPENSQTVIVGWYKNATVFRRRPFYNGRFFNIQADRKDGFLLPEDQRTFPQNDVRYIAINDHFDSINPNSTDSDIAGIKNWFNEFFAKDTSRKIRAVQKAKGERGERLTVHVPYGYRKDPEDKTKWIIDEEAAQVVKKIFTLCMNGRGPSQIAEQLEREKILTPTAYKTKQGVKTPHTEPENPYRWHESTIVNILERKEYIGATVNFKTYTNSIWDKKQRENPEENQKIFYNTHPAIIKQEVFDKVQEIRQQRHRRTATGKSSPFSGLVFCADCRQKLYYSTTNYFEKRQDFFICSTHRANKDKCSGHYIRAVVLEDVVWKHMKEVISFVSQYEAHFRVEMEQKLRLQSEETIKVYKKRLAQAEKRIGELDRLFIKIYEDNAKGNLSDERFAMMSKTYEDEQAQLKVEIVNLQKEVEVQERQIENLEQFIQRVRRYTTLTELTPYALRELVKAVYVEAPDKSSGKRKQKVHIEYDLVGYIPVDELIKAEQA